MVQNFILFLNVMTFIIFIAPGSRADFDSTSHTTADDQYEEEVQSGETGSPLYFEARPGEAQLSDLEKTKLTNLGFNIIEVENRHDLPNDACVLSTEAYGWAVFDQPEAVGDCGIRFVVKGKFGDVVGAVDVYGVESNYRTCHDPSVHDTGEHLDRNNIEEKRNLDSLIRDLRRVHSESIRDKSFCAPALTS